MSDLLWTLAPVTGTGLLVSMVVFLAAYAGREVD